MKPLAAAVSLLLVFGCATPAEKGDETALRTQEADRGAYALPQQANPGDYPDLRPTTTERPKPRVSRSAPRTTVARPKVATPATGDFWYRLSWCESRHRQDAVSSTGKYLSYFQWSLSTWRAAKDPSDPADPRQVSYQRQVVIAQRWAARTNPWTQWPVCWGRALNG